MSISKKKTVIKILIVVPFLCILLCGVVLFLPPWPTKARLCHDVENYIPKDECMVLEDRFEILDRAFPIGETSADDIQNALGNYFQSEWETTYGHCEMYYLSVIPIDYIFSSQESYFFCYDHNGFLLRFSYES